MIDELLEALVFPAGGKAVKVPEDKRDKPGYGKAHNYHVDRINSALTAIYEIGLGVIDSAELDQNYKTEYHEGAAMTKASQRKAWAKACGVAE